MPPKTANKPKKLVSEESKLKAKKSKAKSKLARIKDDSDEDTPVSGDELIGGDSNDNETANPQEDAEQNEVEQQYEEIDEDDVLDGEGREIDNEDVQEDDDVQDDDMEMDEKDMGGDEDECIYKFTKKKSEFVVDEDIDEEYFSEEEAFIPENEVYVSDAQRITKPVLTKYERVRLLGERTKQLSLGAKSMIKGIGNMDPKEVARLELKKKVMPLIVIRPLPSGRKEKWKISELEIGN
jgi:DNA-directed RNA polymerase subunit K/omega